MVMLCVINIGAQALGFIKRTLNEFVMRNIYKEILSFYFSIQPHNMEQKNSSGQAETSGILRFGVGLLGF